MGEIRTGANIAFDDYNISDLPASGVKEPVKADVRALFGLIEDEIGRVEGLAAEQIAWTSHFIRVRATGDVAISSALENGAVLNGVTLTTGDHVFLGRQSNPAQNGLYTAPASGAASRASFADSAAELAHVGFVIQEGAAGRGERWTLALDADDIDLGVTSLAFSPVGIGGAYEQEVIDARDGEGNLKDRIDAVDAKVRSVATESLAIGPAALAAGSPGSASTAVGESALNAATGNQNTAMGRSALASLTTGANNVAVGDSTGPAMTNAVKNVVVGSEAMTNNVSGSENTGVGYRANFAATGDRNTGVGSEALRLLTTGGVNIGVGYLSGYRLTTGSGNVFIGAESGSDPLQKVDVNGSVAIGYGAYTTENGQIVLGNPTDANRVDIFGEMFLKGERAFQSWPDIDNYFAMGAGPSVKPADTGSGDPAANVGFGRLALSSLTGGITNTAFGDQALRDLTTGIDNTAFGQEALSSQISGIGNTGVGKWALRHATTPSSNTGLGDTALEFTTTGGSNTAVGYGSGYKNTTGTDNTFVGVYAGGAQGAGSSDRSTYSKSVAVGAEAMNFNLTGEQNTLIGYRSGHVLTSANNVGVGFESLRRVTTGAGNTAAGHNAGSRTTTGADNIFLGRGAGADAGTQLATASNSIGIGADVNTLASNQVILGNASITHTVLRGGVGIGLGTTVAAGNLHMRCTSGATSALFERDDATDQFPAVVRIRQRRVDGSGNLTNMSDGFGAAVVFQITDDAAVNNPIGTIGAVRRGADNTGEIRLWPHTAGVQQEGIVIRDRIALVGWNTAPQAGGSNGFGWCLSSVANFGVFCGSGAPTMSAAKGSLYMRTDGSGTNDRVYVNNDGSTGWSGVLTNLVTTVSGLPSAASVGAGARAFVTDANATTFAGVVAGGGTNGVPVYCDGTNWRIG